MAQYLEMKRNHPDALLFFRMGDFYELFFEDAILAGQALGITMGVALLVMPLIGAWALVRELQFGLAADRLGRTLDAEGGMPAAPEHLRSSGRLLPEDADRLLAEYGSAAAAEPEDWRAQYRLGVVQDAAGHRKDARAAIRAAIRLAR